LETRLEQWAASVMAFALELALTTLAGCATEERSPSLSQPLSVSHAAPLGAFDGGLDASADAGDDARVGPAVADAFILDLAMFTFERRPCSCCWGLDSMFVNGPPLPWVERSPDLLGGQVYHPDEALTQFFGRSPTSMAVLLGFSYAIGQDGTGLAGWAPITVEDQHGVAERLNAELGGEHVLVVPSVMPNDRIDLQLARMERLAAAGDVVAWQLTPGWGPGTAPLPEGHWLDDDVGLRTIDKGIELGVAVFLVDKGWNRPIYSPTYVDPIDVGRVAKRFAEARFVVLHAASELPQREAPEAQADEVDAGADAPTAPEPEPLWREGPYQELVDVPYPTDRGIDRLIRSLRDNGIGPNENVYASLNGVWAHVMEYPEEAAHVLGKLLLHIGEDNVLWASEGLIYGGPAPQIAAFMDFQIPAELRAAHGYPELTPQRKIKILGANAARLLGVDPLPPPVLAEADLDASVGGDE